MAHLFLFLFFWGSFFFVCYVLSEWPLACAGPSPDSIGSTTFWDSIRFGFDVVVVVVVVVVVAVVFCRIEPSSGCGR